MALGWIENAREHHASVGTWSSSRCAYRVHRSKADTLGQYGASRSHGDGIDAMSCMIALTERHDRVRPYAEEQLTPAHRATNFGERTSARSARWPDPMWHRLVSPPKSMSSWRPSTMHAPVCSAVSTASLMISASSDLDVGVNAHHAFRGEIKSPRMTIRSSPVSANVGLLALRPSRKRAIPARSSCRLNIARSPRHCPTIVRSIFFFFSVGGWVVGFRLPISGALVFSNLGPSFFLKKIRTDFAGAFVDAQKKAKPPCGKKKERNAAREKKARKQKKNERRGNIVSGRGARWVGIGRRAIQDARRYIVH